jgi:hypothetical protein
VSCKAETSLPPAGNTTTSRALAVWPLDYVPNGRDTARIRRASPLWYIDRGLTHGNGRGLGRRHFLQNREGEDLLRWRVVDECDDCIASLIKSPSFERSETFSPCRPLEIQLLMMRDSFTFS